MPEVDLSPFPLDAIDAAFDQGKLLDAYQLAVSTGIPLDEWPDGPARRTAAMLYYPLGNERKGRVLDYLNWRRQRDHPDYFLHSLFARSPWSPAHLQIPQVLRFLPSVQDPKDRANLLAYLAGLYSALRQHSLADRSIAQALEADASTPWIHVQKASLYASRDLYEEALDVARHALSLDPFLRPSILQVAELLNLLNRTDEAIGVLLDAHHRTQHPAYSLRLQAIYSNREDHRQALWCIDQALTRLPLISDDMRKWLSGRRADFLYLAGDFDGFLAACDEKNEGFHQLVAANFRRPGARERKRVKLEVPFIRQHRMTCAPATLASLSEFWNQPHDHLAIADAICREGTPSEKQRRWAEENGFVAREFRVTTGVTQALIDRGIPFTLTTRWATGAHLQACIGYDDRLDVILLRDPTLPHYTEYIFSKLLEDHPLDGPRGMTFIPQSLAHLLDGIELPDEDLYHAQHRFFLAIEGHDQAAIRSSLEELRRLGPRRALTRESHVMAAGYLRQWPEYLEEIESLLADYPKSDELTLRKSYALAELERRQEQRDWLQQAVERSKDSIFLADLGELLTHDAREFDNAERLLRRAIRLRPSEGRHFASLAFLRQKQLRFDEAWKLYLYAASLNPDRENFASLAFEAARLSHQLPQGLEFLAARCETHGRLNSAPWVTHARCLAQLNRHQDAYHVLEQGRRQLPGEGSLLAEGGSMMIYWGPELRDIGSQWLRQAEKSIPEAQYHRYQTRALSFLGHRKEAIHHARRVVAAQPLDEDAWRDLVRLLAEEEGEQAALEPLKDICRQYPRQLSLWMLLAEWQNTDNDLGLPTLDHILEQDPRHFPARLERTFRRLRASRREDALADVRELLLAHPLDARSHGAHGFVLKALDRPAEAAQAFRQAIARNVDYTYALRQLLELADHPKARAEILHFTHREILRQVSSGDAITTYQEVGWSNLEPRELLSQLEAISHDRPDLWSSWAAVMDQALAMEDFPKALEAAETLTTRFPLLSAGWLQRSRAHRHARQPDLEEAALRRALELTPAWDEPARTLATLLERTHRLPEAEAILRRTIDLNPLASANYEELALFLHRNGQTPEALEILRKACDTFPFDSWCWELRTRWSSTPAERDTIAAAIRLHLERYRQRIPVWHLAASTFEALQQPAETVRVLREALEQFPGNPELADRLAALYCNSGDFRAAWAVCESAKANVPIQGRKAYIRHCRGETRDAIADMQQLLEKEPDYYWGLRELASWLESDKEWNALHSHAKKWLRYYPHEAMPYAYLGRAARELARPAEAFSAYLKAFQLEPGFRYVGNQLMQLHLEGHQLEQAPETLKLLRRFASGPETELFATRLALRQGNVQEAVDTACQLLSRDGVDASQVHTLYETLKGPALKKLRSIVRKDLRRKHQVTGAKWMLLQFGQSVAKVLKAGPAFLASQPLDLPSRHHVWSWLLELSLEDRDAARKLVPRWIHKHRRELEDHPDHWVRTSYVLINLKLYKLGVEWLRHWSSRPDASCASAINYAICVAATTKQPLEASKAVTAIHLEAIRLFPHDRDVIDLHASCSLHLLAAGRQEQAREHFEATSIHICSPYYAHLARAASAYFYLVDGHETQARSELRTALDFFRTTRPNAADLDALNQVTAAIARQVPQAAGRPAKLLKLWSISSSKLKASATGNPDNLHALIGLACVLLYFVVRFLIKFND